MLTNKTASTTTLACMADGRAHGDFVEFTPLFDNGLKVVCGHADKCLTRRHESVSGGNSEGGREKLHHNSFLGRVVDAAVSGRFFLVIKHAPELIKNHRDVSQ